MNSVLEFIYDRGKMLEVLTLSKDRGTVVGINALILGRGTHLTAVESISSDHDCIISLKPFDVTGHILERNKIRLSEISSVIPFTSVFENPLVRSFAKRSHQSQIN
jgi:hypothetical protein